MSASDYFKQVRTLTRAAWRTRKPRNKVAVLGRVWQHHARRSGYHRLGEGMGMWIEPGCHLLPQTIGRRIEKWRGIGPIDAGLQVRWMMKLGRRRQLVIMDGDWNLELVYQLRRLSPVQLIVVFHQPPDQLAENLAEAPRGIIDVAVAVSRCQMPLLEPLVPPGCCRFIPHGVDTEYFSPTGQARDPNLVICVGVHRRDFKLLGQAAHQIRRENPAAIVRLIAPKTFLPADMDLSALDLAMDLTDEQLREHYQRAAVLLMPMDAATANNAILEAMAAGCPVVATDVGGVRDYMDETCGALCPPGDVDAHARAVLDLLRQPEVAAQAGKTARQRIERFAWPVIRQEMQQLLTEFAAVSLRTRNHSV